MAVNATAGVVSLLMIVLVYVQCMANLDSNSYKDSLLDFKWRGGAMERYDPDIVAQ